jgi:hypothetical protein
MMLDSNEKLALVELFGFGGASVIVVSGSNSAPAGHAPTRPALIAPTKTTTAVTPLLRKDLNEIPAKPRPLRPCEIQTP